MITRVRTLTNWLRRDERQPYPWSWAECPGCTERELTADFVGPTTRFVCMACGCRATVSLDGVAEFWR